MLKKIFAASVLAVPFIANAAPPDALLGKWKHVVNENMQVEVEKNGNNYIVTEYKDDIPFKYVGTPQKDGVSLSQGPMTLVADIEAKTGNLIMGGHSYRKLKAGEKFESESTTFRSKGGIPKAWQ